MKESVFGCMFPYSLQRQQDGQYVLLDRDYRPLGCPVGEEASYATAAVRLKRLTSQTAARLSVTGSSDVDQIWLYDGESDPRKSPENARCYLERLVFLMKLQS